MPRDKVGEMLLPSFISPVDTIDSLQLPIQFLMSNPSEVCRLGRYVPPWESRVSARMLCNILHIAVVPIELGVDLVLLKTDRAQLVASANITRQASLSIVDRPVVLKRHAAELPGSPSAVGGLYEDIGPTDTMLIKMRTYALHLKWIIHGKHGQPVALL